MLYTPPPQEAEEHIQQKIDKGLTRLAAEESLSLRALCAKVRREMPTPPRSTKPEPRETPDGIEVYAAGDLQMLRTRGEWQERSCRPPLYQGPLADYWLAMFHKASWHHVLI